MFLNDLHGGGSVVGSFYSNCMKPLSKVIRTHEYIGFDVETIGDKNTFYSGGIYYYKNNEPRFKYFTNQLEMCAFILARKFRNKYIVATNLEFDLTVLFFNTPYWNKFNILSRGGKILYAVYRLGNNNGKIKFLDTTNYVFWGVEKLGEIIGIPKMEKPEFLGKRIPKDRWEYINMMMYNQRDCKISCDFMYFLQDGFNELGGNAKLTIASTSLNTWRMGYQEIPLLKESYVLNDDKIKDFIFSGYYGGRTEVFKRGTFEDVFYYDINSLYPSVMCMDLPLPQSIQKVDIPNIDNIYKYMGVTECYVSCPQIDKPLLPLRHDGKLLFPSGNFKGTWNNCELAKALDLGYQIIPIKQIIYTESFQPFKTFVEVLYNKRLEYKKDKSPMELVAKLLLNSLYGKFATKHINGFRIIDMKDMTYTEILEATKNIEHNVKNNKILIRTEKEFNGIYAFPILSSYITSYARLVMYDYIKDKDVIYTDTDSIVTLTEKYQDSKELGKLKLEAKIKTAMFVKPKFYIIDDSVKIKGISKANKEDFNKALKHESIDKIKFLKIKESFRRGMNPNQIVSIKKNLNLSDNKRIWEHENLDIVSLSKPIFINQEFNDFEEVLI